MAVKKEDEVSAMNIYERLAEIRKIASVVKKDKQGFNYKYTDLNEILVKVTAGMAKYKVSLLPYIVWDGFEIDLKTLVSTKIKKDGTSYDNKTSEYQVKGRMFYKWVCNDNPDDCIEIPWILVGSHDAASQALGSALTYTERQFLTNYFQMAQTDSVDAEQYYSKQKEAEAYEDKMIAQSLIQTIDEAIRGYIEANPKKTEDVRKFCLKYAKRGNYKSIEDPDLAAAMLEDFKKSFLSDNPVEKTDEEKKEVKEETQNEKAKERKTK